MSPAWFLVGVMLCYFHVIDGAVYFGGLQQSDDTDDTYNSQYYCPAELVLNGTVPNHNQVWYCGQDSDCNGLSDDPKIIIKCCSAIILFKHNAGHNTFNRCVVAEKKSTRGYCPKLLIWMNGLTPFHVKCIYDHNCEHDQVCCYSGFGKPKMCMAAEKDPPIKFADKICPARDPDNDDYYIDCASGFDCPGEQKCCNLKCRDA